MKFFCFAFADQTLRFAELPCSPFKYFMTLSGRQGSVGLWGRMLKLGKSKVSSPIPCLIPWPKGSIRRECASRWNILWVLPNSHVLVPLFPNLECFLCILSLTGLHEQCKFSGTTAACEKELFSFTTCRAQNTPLLCMCFHLLLPCLCIGRESASQIPIQPPDVTQFYRSLCSQLNFSRWFAESRFLNFFFWVRVRNQKYI